MAIVVGWREWVALPGLGIVAINAKVDTGARSSALHVDTQWRFTEGGAPWVGFTLTVQPTGTPIEAVAALVDEREVTDSGGHRTRRAFLRTRLSLAGVDREVEVNLAERRGMRFPMLLGRTALAGVFTVDPAGSYLVSGAPA